MIIFYPLLETGILALASLVSAYNSFFLIPLVPIMLELACETAFPVGEGAAAGLLVAMGNFAGFVLGIILSLIVQGKSKAQSAGGLGFSGQPAPSALDHHRFAHAQRRGARLGLAFPLGPGCGLGWHAAGAGAQRPATAL
jgi:hypothetical protein